MKTAARAEVVAQDGDEDINPFDDAPKAESTPRVIARNEADDEFAQEVVTEKSDRVPASRSLGVEELPAPTDNENAKALEVDSTILTQPSEPIRLKRPVEEQVEKPVREEPVRAKPVRAKSVREEPVHEEPVHEEPVHEEPVHKEPVRVAQQSPDDLGSEAPRGRRPATPPREDDLSDSVTREVAGRDHAKAAPARDDDLSESVPAGFDKVDPS